MMLAKTTLRLKPFRLLRYIGRSVGHDKLSNKRITRIQSDIELDDCRLINRNPRNLEQMSYDMKPQGFWLDKTPPGEWNKLIFEQSAGDLRACLRHWSGRTILEASTSEPQLSKYLKSTNTVQAATMLGQILARRCLQSGYLYAVSDARTDDEKGVKLKAFQDAVQSEGFMLDEPPAIMPRSATDL